MIKVLGIPTILGCNKKGCELAPKYIRDADLISALKSSGESVEDLGDISINNTFQTDKEINSGVINFTEIKNVVDKTFFTLTSEVKNADKFLCIGGDHSMAMGSVFAAREKHEDLAVIWIDAHADSNSPISSPTGNAHGMPLSTVVGDSLFIFFDYKAVKKSNVVLFGIKDVDQAEWDYIHENKITYYTIDDIVEKGVGKIWQEIEKKIGHLPIHVSMDIDGLDNSIAPGTGIINNGGINYREIKYLARKISQKNLVSMDLTEVNPLNDIDNKTQFLSVELISDFFRGKWTEYERYLEQSKVESGG